VLSRDDDVAFKPSFASDDYSSAGDDILNSPQPKRPLSSVAKGARADVSRQLASWESQKELTVTHLEDDVRVRPDGVRQATMHTRVSAEQRGMSGVIALLERQERTIELIDVMSDHAYRTRDIDLVWLLRDDDGNAIRRSIEVKVDTQAHRTGNFAFETTSNDTTGSPGCFMYSEADWFYYLFAGDGRLFIFPLKETRDWFTRQLEVDDQAFRRFKTATVDASGRHMYHTLGRLVPVRIAMAAISKARLIQLPT
jgi:hypothetical protein